MKYFTQILTNKDENMNLIIKAENEKEVRNKLKQNYKFKEILIISDQPILEERRSNFKLGMDGGKPSYQKKHSRVSLLS